MDTSIVAILLVGLCLVGLALHLKSDVEAMFKVPLFTFSLKARDRRERKRVAKRIEDR